MRRSVRLLLAMLLVLAGFAGSGCKTTEPENDSARPWNSPRGWETGMPGMMPQYRR